MQKRKSNTNNSCINTMGLSTRSRHRLLLVGLIGFSMFLVLRRSMMKKIEGFASSSSSNNNTEELNTQPTSSPTTQHIHQASPTCNCTFIPSTWYAQAGQDRYIFKEIFAKDCERCGGTFVEFGARNGIDHSNTYSYEKYLGWNGLMFEMDPREYGELKENRFNSEVRLGPVCPSYQSNVTLLLSKNGGWSGVVGSYEPTRTNMKRDDIQNISCYHLATELRSINMHHVDYMTIDTEGTEQLIIEDFPWQEFNIRVVQIEQLNERRYPAQRGKKQAIIDFMVNKMNYTLLSVYVVAQMDTDDLIFIKDPDDAASFIKADNATSNITAKEASNITAKQEDKKGKKDFDWGTVKYTNNRR